MRIVLRGVGVTKALIRGSLFFFAFRFLAFAATLSAADQPAPAPPGPLVDVGGRKLHLYCTGQGSPTVVLEAAAGGFSIDWALLETEIANTTRVCSYDRAGYGWSDPGPEWHTVEQVAHDLETALKNEPEHSPYVHQASLTPDSLAGLPLVVLTPRERDQDEQKQQTELAPRAEQPERNGPRQRPLHSDRAT
jgi:hypothetical protein